MTMMKNYSARLVQDHTIRYKNKPVFFKNSLFQSFRSV